VRECGSGPVLIRAWPRSPRVRTALQTSMRTGPRSANLHKTDRQSGQYSDSPPPLLSIRQP